MVAKSPGRSLRHGAAAALMLTLLITPAVAAQEGSGALSQQVDIAAFSSRAAAWSEASVAQRAESLLRATALGEDAKAAEEEAQAEAERQAAEAERRRIEAEAAAAAAATSTTTTVPPATTAPTTVAPSDSTAPESTTTTTTPVSAEGPTAEQWEALRQCESSGRYDAVSSNERYRGAYQCSQATWDWVASIHHPSLVGIDPAAAAPSDQDAQAYALYAMRGASQWPTCGVNLG